MSRHLREAVADWLMLIGALVLFLSLFFVWSHQIGPAFAVHWHSAVPLRQVPRDPTGWQVYSAADVLLTLVAVAIVFVSFLGTRRARLVACVPVLVAGAFVFHAQGTPPTNSVNVITPSIPLTSDVTLLAPAAPTAKTSVTSPTRVQGTGPPAPQAPPAHPRSGTGETLALVGLGVALVGLALSFTAD